jgi:NAD(P)-dependent dehydrogenase (short-subunit alcohol dehydrogenase family)
VSGAERRLDPSRHAVVTGGSRGIGAAVSRRLAADGFHVHVLYRSSHEAALDVGAKIEADGGRCSLWQCDVDVEQQIVATVRSILAETNRIDALVNNAGITADGLLAMTDTGRWERVIRTNLIGTYLMCREVLPVMLDRRGGRIVNVSSNSVRIPGPGQSSYAAAKGGVEALTRALAVEVGRKGIRVNAVAPGRVRTEMTAPVVKQLGGSAGHPRWGEPEDIAGLVAFLVGDEADYIQGQTITADGGRLVVRPRGEQV